MMEKLRFVKFSELNEWDIKRIVKQKTNFLYPLCKLGKILSKADVEWVEIEDDKVYPILGVHAHGEGVYINRYAKGKELTMKSYQKSQANLLFYCKVRTVNGQWGIVYPEFENSYGSSNMQYLNINTKLLIPEFLELLLKLERITNEWDKNAIGANGRHFTLKTLLSFEIPLPPIEEQRKIINKYHQFICQATEKEAKAKTVEREIERYLMDELGISHNKLYETNLESSFEVHEPSVEYVVNIAKKQDDETTYHWDDEIKKEYSKLQFVSFKDLDRWDYYNIKDSFISTMKKSPYPIFELGMVYDFINRCWDKKEKQFEYVEIGSVDSLNGIEYSETIQTKDAPSRATQIIREGDLIIGTTRPYLKKFAIVDDNYDGCVCSSGFQVIAPSEKYNIHFLYEFLMSSIAVEQFELYMTGALYPAITTKDLKKIQIPLPPLDVQNAIVAHISELKEQIKSLKQEAKELREKALKEFEKEVFEN